MGPIACLNWKKIGIWKEKDNKLPLRKELIQCSKKRKKRAIIWRSKKVTFGTFVGLSENESSFAATATWRASSPTQTSQFNETGTIPIISFTFKTLNLNVCFYFSFSSRLITKRRRSREEKNMIAVRAIEVDYWKLSRKRLQLMVSTLLESSCPASSSS